MDTPTKQIEKHILPELVKIVLHYCDPYQEQHKRISWGLRLPLKIINGVHDYWYGRTPDEGLDNHECATWRIGYTATINALKLHTKFDNEEFIGPLKRPLFYSTSDDETDPDSDYDWF